MNSNFEEIRIVDNFYQTSSFFPMPVVAVSTIAEDGGTNIGPYSLCFPYYVAGKDYYAMLLETRNSSNTARNILRSKVCSLNFLNDNRYLMKECVRLGFPGDSTEEKMANCAFTLLDSPDGGPHKPKIVDEAFQVFECTWDSSLEQADRFTPAESYDPPYNDFNGITSETGAHFILKIDKILMKPVYREAILSGLSKRKFPPVPVDYGYRDNTDFWIARFKKPFREKIPEGKGTEVSTVYYAANRIDPEVSFTEEACAKLVKVPRIFLTRALSECAVWAKERGISELTAEHMDEIRDKRAAEKSGSR
jgi:flavin reductase (DIM6/NTAB) family NADH-FMN oxidoreductase RutF